MGPQLGAELKVITREGALEQLDEALTEQPHLTMSECRDHLARKVTEARQQKAKYQKRYEELND